MRLLLVLLLAGCAAIKWSKPGTSNQDFYRDDDQCQAQSESTAKGPVDKRDYEACMLAKGWRKQG